MTDARGHSREMAADTIKPRAIDATLMAARCWPCRPWSSSTSLALKQAKDYLEQARRDQN